MLKSFFSALADLATNARRLAMTFAEFDALLRGQLNMTEMPALPEPEAEAEPARKRKAS